MGKKEILQENKFNPIEEMIAGGPEQEIGTKMTENFVSVLAGTPVKQAMRALIKQAADNDNISIIYVVDEENMLVGAISLKDLIIARESTKLEDITERNCQFVYADELIDECMERLIESDEDSVPVLDSENRLVGVLLAQDITHLVDEAMGDDYAKLGGLTAEEDMQEPLKQSIRKRLPWLVISEMPYVKSAALGAKVKGNDYRSIDIGIAAAYLTAEATAQGLSSCILGWFDDAKLRPITGLDAPTRLVIALGYAAPEEEFRAKVRKDLDQLADWKE